ncbi:hypothetical protein [Rhodoligotrophos defluvii]|uniref:hypothetical protein n=1 Tax=Rhodoligotrophos defluvii TaxID=2561934 RepID=UPI0010C95965|nr:hypothetical protein [Rhodoligotrophos defluvii]
MNTVTTWLTPWFSISVDYGWQSVGLGFTVYHWPQDPPQLALHLGPLEIWFNLGPRSREP